MAVALRMPETLTFKGILEMTDSVRKPDMTIYVKMIKSFAISFPDFACLLPYNVSLLKQASFKALCNKQ